MGNHIKNSIKMAGWKDTCYFIVFGIFAVGIPVFYEVIYILFWFGALGNTKNRCIISENNPAFKNKPLPQMFAGQTSKTEEFCNKAKIAGWPCVDGTTMFNKLFISGSFFFIAFNVTMVMLCIQLYKHHGRENKSFMAYLLYGLNTLVIMAGFT